MEYIEQTSGNTFYPFQNKFHQIHQHRQIVKILRPLKNQNIVRVIKWEG